MVISWLTQILGDEGHLQGRERAQMRVIAEGVELAAKFGVGVNPKA